MNVPTNDAQRVQAFHRVRNLIPSRERIEELRRIARFVETGANLEQNDVDLLDGFADLLLDIRQAVRGGSKEIRGSRHWTEQ